MTFTYLGTLATDLDRVRFYTGDSGATGIRPDATHITDEEINGLLAAEGSVGRAVAAVYETLAASFAQYADLQLGPRRESLSQIAARYASLGADWRKKYGTGASGGSTAGARAITRVDGYSQDVASDAV